jgi:hypothetical protein
VSTAGFDAILDDLRAGLARRAAARRARARTAAAGTLAAVAIAAAVAGGAALDRGTGTLAVSSGASSSDATVLLRGCAGDSSFACGLPLAPKSS